MPYTTLDVYTPRVQFQYSVRPIGDDATNYPGGVAALFVSVTSRDSNAAKYFSCFQLTVVLS